MTSLLLIIITIIIIIAVVVIGPIITRKLNVKANFYIIGGYLAVLVALSVICILIPSSALKEPIDPAQAAQYIKNGSSMGTNIGAGNFDAPEGFKKTENSFISADDTIIVSCAGDLNGMVYVGTKGVDVPDNGNDKIDVYSYNSGYVSLNDAFYIAQTDPPVIALDSTNNLLINSAEKKSIEFFRFDDNYAISQFTKVHALYGGSSFSSLTVVVLLPPGVTVIGSGYLPLSDLVPALSFGS